jgi:hypothetical protein
MRKLRFSGPEHMWELLEGGDYDLLPLLKEPLEVAGTIRVADSGQAVKRVNVVVCP